MNYPLLQQNDKLPTVGVLQKLLNRTGYTLQADGVFGPNTRAAVTDFQRKRRLTADGSVGAQTWPRLVSRAALPIVDCVDVFDPSLYSLEAADLARVGAAPITIGGMSGGVEQAISLISQAGRNIFLLRFHGHGAPGVAGISFGQGSVGWGEHADLDSANIARFLPLLRRLRPLFGPYGSVQFMHCETGAGPKGRLLLGAIASELGVPVTAGVHVQYGGGASTFKFEGPTYTAFAGGSLGTWCRGLPDFVGESVA